MEKADGLATEGAMEDEGFSAQLGAKSARSPAVRSKHSLIGGGIARLRTQAAARRKNDLRGQEKKGKQGIERSGVPRPAGIA